MSSNQLAHKLTEGHTGLQSALYRVPCAVLRPADHTELPSVQYLLAVTELPHQLFHSYPAYPEHNQRSSAWPLDSSTHT